MVLKLIKYDDKNQVLGVLGIARNITELKKSQEELEFEKNKI